jgi:ubiquitin-conjugating enzyme (huntingtin interacting protein 2)
MYPNSKTRIQKEFQELQKSKEMVIIMVGQDLFHWKGTIGGPSDTPYDGGKFTIDIKIPPNYPYHPPTMKFDTKIWHPNMSSQTGAICLDILKNEWSPALSIRTALLSIQALMCVPEANDPQDAVVANQYKENIALFNKTAKEWTMTHANPDSVEKSKISKLLEMGFDEAVSRAALEKNGWDENAAINSLLC